MFPKSNRSHRRPLRLTKNMKKKKVSGKAQFLQIVQTSCGLLPFSMFLPFLQPFLPKRITFKLMFLALSLKKEKETHGSQVSISNFTETSERYSLTIVFG